MTQLIVTDNVGGHIRNVFLTEAWDWYDSSGVDEYVARVGAGESIEDVAASMEQEIEAQNKYNSNKYWVVTGIQAYLEYAWETS
jgi:broad specificity phosphatase PhoE